jgi:hypothetical protein
MTFDREEKAAAIEWYFAVDCLATSAYHKQTEVLVQQGKAVPLQACYRPMGFQEFEARRLLDNQHIKVVRL